MDKPQWGEEGDQISALRNVFLQCKSSFHYVLWVGVVTVCHLPVKLICKFVQKKKKKVFQSTGFSATRAESKMYEANMKQIRVAVYKTGDAEGMQHIGSTDQHI